MRVNPPASGSNKTSEKRTPCRAAFAPQKSNAGRTGGRGRSRIRPSRVLGAARRRREIESLCFDVDGLNRILVSPESEPKPPSDSVSAETVRCENLSHPVPAAESSVPELTPNDERAESRLSGRGPSRYRVVLYSLIVGLTVVAGIRLTLFDLYRVETRAVFARPDETGIDSIQRPFEKEMEVLRNPRLFHLTARDLSLLGRASGTIGTPDVSPSRLVQSLAGGVSSAPQDSSHVAAFAHRLATALEIRPEPASGTAAISIQGTDPKYLKAVLASFMKHYCKHRGEVLQREALTASRSVGVDRDREADRRFTQVVERLRSVEDESRECRFALKLLNDAGGTFGGFLPDGRLMGIPSLDSFQSKITALEIEKKALSVRFQPSSREIRSVDMQINGIREAMKERIRQHLVFLKKKKRDLTALKAQLEDQMPASGPTSGRKERCLGFPNENQESPDECLTCSYDPPYTASRPILVTAEDRLGPMVRALTDYAGIVKTAVEERLGTFPFRCSLDDTIPRSSIVRDTRLEPIQRTGPVQKPRTGADTDRAQSMGPTAEALNR